MSGTVIHVKHKVISASKISGQSPIPDLCTKNITTFGAIDSGADDSAAFQSFNNYASGSTCNPLTLIIPAGTYTTPNDHLPFDGISSLFVDGAGATLPGYIRTTGIGGYAKDSLLTTVGARVQTVNIGDTSCTLINQSDASKFAIGDWCSLTALELQGSAGYPPNFQYNQFLQITGINGAIISLSAAALNKYKSTYPQTNPNSNYDTGGPATLFKMVGATDQGSSPKSWITSVVINGINFVGSLQTYGPGISMTYTNCSFSGTTPVPTINQTFVARNCTVSSGNIEVDKDCSLVEFDSCNVDSMSFQNGSVQNSILTNCNFSSYINGTPRNMIIQNCSIGSVFAAGTQGYGRTDSLTVSNVTCASLFAGTFFNRSLISDFTISLGRLTFNAGVLNWGVEGPALIGGINLKWAFAFNILDIVEEIGTGKTVLVTNLPDPLPTIPVQFGTPFFVQNPCFHMTSTNFTGCPEAIDHNNLVDQPIYSHLLRTSDFAISQSPTILGLLISITVNVTISDTGPNANSTLLLAVPALDPTGAYFLWNTVNINCKTTGQRTITPTTITGAQVGDVIAAPGLITFTNHITLQHIEDISGYTQGQKPVITVEISTDQSSIY